MKPLFCRALPLLFLLAAVGCEPRTQPDTAAPEVVVPITTAQLVAAWDRMTAMVVASAKLMPAEQYGFTPGEPLRVFAEQINHTAGANYLFADTFKRARPEVAVEGRDKATVVQDLEASFRFVREGLAALTAADLTEEVEWFGRSMSRLQALLTMTDHLQREHGKTIMYLRAQGVAPAQSAGW